MQLPLIFSRMRHPIATIIKLTFLLLSIFSQCDAAGSNGIDGILHIFLDPLPFHDLVVVQPSGDAVIRLRGYDLDGDQVTNLSYYNI